MPTNEEAQATADAEALERLTHLRAAGPAEGPDTAQTLQLTASTALSGATSPLREGHGSNDPSVHPQRTHHTSTHGTMLLAQQSRRPSAAQVRRGTHTHTRC
jgi:hypothetical protein